MQQRIMYASLLIFGLITFVNGKKPVLPEELQEIIGMVRSECIETTGVAEEDIGNCDKGIFKDDQKLKCYMFCLFEEANIVEDDGTVNYDILIGLLPAPYDKIMASGIQICKKHDSLDKDKCQRAFDVHKCLYETDPEHYILF